MFKSPWWWKGQFWLIHALFLFWKCKFIINEYVLFTGHWFCLSIDRLCEFKPRYLESALYLILSLIHHDNLYINYSPLFFFSPVWLSTWTLCCTALGCWWQWFQAGLLVTLSEPSWCPCRLWPSSHISPVTHISPSRWTIKFNIFSVYKLISRVLKTSTIIWLLPS